MLSVLIFSDLQCPDCAAFQRTLDETLAPRFAGRVYFDHRDFPLPRHTWARAAAVAAHALDAQRPGLGPAFRRWTLDRIAEINAGRFEDFLVRFAAGHDADPARASGPAFEAVVEASFRDGIARGVARTPTVLVGDVPFVESFAIDAVAAAIEEALAGVRT
jgi:protein-disulfide isomerase